MMRFSLISVLSLCSTLVTADSGEKRFVPLGTQNLLETGGGLLLILLLILGGAWLFKRYAQLPMVGKNLITVQGGVSVGPRERVVVIKIEEIRLVLGVAPGQVRALHILDADEPEVSSFKSQLAVEKLEE